jgi:hypothetical protein
MLDIASGGFQQLTEPTLQLRPIDAIGAFIVVIVVTVFFCRNLDSNGSNRRPFMRACVDWIGYLVGCVVEDVTVRILESARIQRSVVSASCSIMESPKFRDSFQEFLESEHVKASCARVVQDIAETPGVAQGISSGALNTGMIAALGVARQVPLVGRFVPPAADTKGDREAHHWENMGHMVSPLSPRPTQAYLDIPHGSPRARTHGHSADAECRTPRDRGLSSASTQASSSVTSNLD